MTQVKFPEFIKTIALVFGVDPLVISRATSSVDIDGWDSVTHAHLLFEIEDKYKVELPADRVFECKNVGELFDLLSESLPPHDLVLATKRKKLIIVYGNCQAEHIAGHLNYLPSLRDDARFEFLLNFCHPTNGWGQLPDNVLAEADFLWEQYDEAYRFPYADRLASSCQTIRFPPLDFNLLWPFAAKDPRNTPEPPDSHLDAMLMAIVSR